MWRSAKALDIKYKAWIYSVYQWQQVSDWLMIGVFFFLSFSYSNDKVLLYSGALGNHFEICSYRLSLRPSEKERRPTTWEHAGGKKKCPNLSSFCWLAASSHPRGTQPITKPECNATSNGGWQKEGGRWGEKKEGSWIRRAPCFAFIFEWTRCLCRADALSDNNLLSCPFAWIFKQAGTLMCTRLQPCIVNQLDSSASLMTHLSLSLWPIRIFLLLLNVVLPPSFPIGSSTTHYMVPMTNINYTCVASPMWARVLQGLPSPCQAGQDPEAGNMRQETVKLTCCVMKTQTKLSVLSVQSSWFTVRYISVVINGSALMITRQNVQVTTGDVLLWKLVQVPCV